MRRWLRARLTRLLGLAPNAEEKVPPPPEVHLVLPTRVPGTLVRLAPAVLVLVCVGLVRVDLLGWGLGVAAAVLVAWRPQWPVVPLVLLLIGLRLLADTDQLGAEVVGRGGMLRTSVIVLAVHLLVRAAALAGHVTWTSVVEGAVLLRLGRALLGVQLVVQTLLLATVWLRGNFGVGAGGQELLRVVAVLAVVAATLVLVPRQWLHRREKPKDAVRHD